MTTAELIERLRDLDPAGDREVGMYIDPEETGIGHIKVTEYDGLVVVAWDTDPVPLVEGEPANPGR